MSIKSDWIIVEEALEIRYWRENSIGKLFTADNIKDRNVFQKRLLKCF